MSLSNSDGSRKRKKKKAQTGQNHYDGIKFIPVEPSHSSGSRPQPGSVNQFFPSSYHVNFGENSTCADVGDPDNKEKKKQFQLQQVVHRHANGLAIVTAGATLQNVLAAKDCDGCVKNESIIGIDNTAKKAVQIQNIRFNIEVSKSQSVGGKRKRARMKNGNNNKIPDTVEPNDILATVTLDNSEVIELKCCVSGTLLEINERLLKSQKNNADSYLLTDPLLDGYLAVIMPSQFPSSL